MTKFDLVGDYTIVRGLPWKFSFQRFQPDHKMPIDLTGCSARLVFINATDPTAPPIEYPGALGGVDGTAVFDLTEANTLAISQPYSRYRLFFTDSLGREVLFFRGRVAVLADE